MSPRRNWDSPNLSLASECATLPPPPRTGGGHTVQGVRGWGSPNSDDWRKSLALFLFCGTHPFPAYMNINIYLPPSLLSLSFLCSCIVGMNITACW
jgi:hypothetical protein